MAVFAILLCGGSGTRMGFDKLFTPLNGITPAVRSARALKEAGAEKAVVVVSDRNRTLAEASCWPLPVTFTLGGAERADSVLCGLHALNAAAEDIVLIHDAARCLMPAEAMRKSITCAKANGSGVCALPLKDSLVRVTDGESETVPRAGMYRTQTPQTFRYGEILRAYEAGAAGCTDDGAVYRQFYGRLSLAEGSERGRKLTDPTDWAWALSLTGVPRTGTGFDTHRLVEGRRLVLGGVEIPYEKGLLGHSDADVLLHALCDAILGAAALGDIGLHFPDSDSRYKDIDSRILLRETVRLIKEKGFCVSSADMTIIAQRPKLRPYIDTMRETVAADLGIDADAVGLKATTTEGMNDEGQGLCISAQAVATLIYIG